MTINEKNKNGVVNSPENENDMLERSADYDVIPDPEVIITNTFVCASECKSKLHKCLIAHILHV